VPATLYLQEDSLQFSAYTICQDRFGVRLFVSHVLVFLRHYFFHAAVMKCAAGDVGLYRKYRSVVQSYPRLCPSVFSPNTRESVEGFYVELDV
jgi:hypothetical protein